MQSITDLRSLARHLVSVAHCREEGLLEGGIVVQDCLLLLMSLLRGNPSNQLMFR